MNPAILQAFSSPYNTAGWAGLDSALSAGMGCSLASERSEEGNRITAGRNASQIQTEILYP